MTAQLAEVVQRDAGNIGTAPYGKLAVTVLTDNDGMHVAAVYVQMLAKQIFQTSGVEHRTRTDDAMGGNPEILYAA